MTVARAVGPLLAAGGLSGQPEPLCGRCASLTACDATGDALRYLMATTKLRAVAGVLTGVTLTTCAVCHDSGCPLSAA